MRIISLIEISNICIDRTNNDIEYILLSLVFNIISTSKYFRGHHQYGTAINLCLMTSEKLLEAE